MADISGDGILKFPGEYGPEDFVNNEIYTIHFRSGGHPGVFVRRGMILRNLVYVNTRTKDLKGTEKKPRLQILINQGGKMSLEDFKAGKREIEYCDITTDLPYPAYISFENIISKKRISRETKKAPKIRTFHGIALTTD